MKRSIRVAVIATALAGGCVAGAAMSQQAALPAHGSADERPTNGQLHVARVAGMHMAATLFYRGVRNGIASGTDVRQLFHEPEGLALWAAAIPGLFPVGSGGGESRARPEIWTNRADFDAKARALRDAATRLLDRARAGDTAGFAAQADAVEAACNACHTVYRNE